MRTRDILPITDTFDAEDIKGWNAGWHFPIAEVLHIVGAEIPDEWQFHPSPFLPASVDDYAEYRDSYESSAVVHAYRAHGADALLYVGRVLDRYWNMFISGTDKDY